MGYSQVNNPIILRISYVYVTYILRIWYVIDSGKIKVCPYFHIKKCVDTTNMGGRTYPVRYYPVAIRLRTVAFGNKVALTVDRVNIEATCASALPKN